MKDEDIVRITDHSRKLQLDLWEAESTIKKLKASLRDQFAMAALQGELSAQNEFLGVWSDNAENDITLAKRCFRVADAMLKAREE